MATQAAAEEPQLRTVSCVLSLEVRFEGIEQGAKGVLDMAFEHLYGGHWSNLRTDFNQAHIQKSTDIRL